MTKFLFIASLVSSIFLLQSSLLFGQSNKKEKLSRQEKAKSYPTTFGTKYFVTPSAIPQNKGMVSIQNTAFRYNSVCYAFAKNHAIGIGLNVFAIFDKNPFFSNSFITNTVSPFITYKTSFQLESKVFIGGGVFVIQDSKATFDIFGMVMFTVGDRNANITLTYVSDFTEDGFHRTNEVNTLSPLSISGMYRLNKYFSIVSENHFLGFGNGFGKFLSISGVRLILKKSAIDLGVLHNERNNPSDNLDPFNYIFTDYDYIHLVPYFGYTLSF